VDWPADPQARYSGNWFLSSKKQSTMPDHPSIAVPAELVEQLRELLADRLSVDEQVRRELKSPDGD